MGHRRQAVVWGLIATLLPGAAALAQDARWETFDITRAWVPESTVYQPFIVTETTLLRDVLRDGTVNDETHVLILERNGWRLALVTAQMLYHHAAQGNRNGEPWMVSF